MPQRRELEFASRQVNSIEINGLFYGLQKPPTFLKWSSAVPETFIFSVKANRFMTHIKKLKNIEEPIANFFSCGILSLEQKLGPVLWQLPPTLKWEPETFTTFLKLLPQDFAAATKLAKKHGPKMKGKTAFPSARVKNYSIRHAVEVRHESFKNKDFLKLLKSTMWP